VPADEDHKREVLAFVSPIIAMGRGSSPIPAMIRAFKAFQNAPDKRGRVMYILTDGEFDTSGYRYKSASGKELMGTEAVIAWLRDNNKDGSVHVYPIILGLQPSPQIEEKMKTIAKENGGEYKYVQPE
jgi:hypothetical protein